MKTFYIFGANAHWMDDITGNSSNITSSCPDGNQVIWETFEQCIDTPLQWASFAVGMGSILFWLCVLLPQIIENCKDMGCVASISAGLLFSWIFGDTTNLVGAVFTKQGLFQVLLGVWFVVTDLVLSSQLIYYHCVYKRTPTWPEIGGDRRRLVMCIMGMVCFSATITGLNIPSVSDSASGRRVGRQLLSVDNDNDKPLFSSVTVILGYALGIVSSIAYFTSRSFQIYKNFKYRNVQGLSTMTFVMAIIGNLLYGLAIVLYSVELHYIILHAPWILGSWGIMFLDSFIVYQIKSYGKDPEETSLFVETPDEEDEPLMNSINTAGGDYGAASHDNVTFR